MRATPENAAELVDMLEAQGESQDRLLSRLQDYLRDMIAEREALERLAQHDTTLRAARLATIVEARALLPRLDQGNTSPCLVPMH